VQAHGVPLRLVQVQTKVIKARHLMKPAGQFMEERGQVAVRDNRFRHSQQGSVRVPTGGYLPVHVSRCHGQNLGQPPIRDQQVVHRPPVFGVACVKSILSIFLVRWRRGRLPGKSQGVSVRDSDVFSSRVQRELPRGHRHEIQEAWSWAVAGRM